MKRNIIGLLFSLFLVQSCAINARANISFMSPERQAAIQQKLRQKFSMNKESINNNFNQKERSSTFEKSSIQKESANIKEYVKILVDLGFSNAYANSILVNKAKTDEQMKILVSCLYFLRKEKNCSVESLMNFVKQNSLENIVHKVNEAKRKKSNNGSLGLQKFISAVQIISAISNIPDNIKAVWHLAKRTASPLTAKAYDYSSTKADSAYNSVLFDNNGTVEAATLAKNSVLKATQLSLLPNNKKGLYRYISDGFWCMSTALNIATNIFNIGALAYNQL